MDQVLTASPKAIHEAPYEYFYALFLSCDFGVARLLFDTKGGRDHLYELLLSRFPKIRRYRWI
jgi:hypothetical protein